MATVEELRLEFKVMLGDALAKMQAMEKQTKAQAAQNKTLAQSFAAMRDVMQGPVAAAKMVINGFKQLKAVTDKMESAWSTQEMAVSNLNAVLKSTGGVAGLTSQELQDMASAFQKVTTFGDETIIAAQAVMLTFKEIGKDIFPAAMESAMDLSTVMGGDLQGATVMLGKALNEPIQGIGALRRVGVQLTDQQEASIKAFMDVNDLASAQAVIMGEVQSQFGGAAKAAGDTASAMKDKLANAIGDVNEEIGRAISNNLKPFRQAWLNMAEAVGAAIKAQNDFSDAMARVNKGTDTAEDRLKIAEDYLQVLQKSLATAKGGGGALAEMYGSTEQLEKDIQLQVQIINGIRATQRYTEQANAAAAAGNKAAADAARLAAEKEARNTEALRLGQEAYQAILDMEAAEQRRFNQFGDLVDFQGLSNKAWAEAEDLLTKSNGLISTANPLYVRLVELSKAWAIAAGEVKTEVSEIAGAADLEWMADRWEKLPVRVKSYTSSVEEATEAQKAMQDAALAGYTAMAEALGAAIISGEDGWKAFGRAGLNAIASVVEAMAHEAKILAGISLAKALTGDFSALAAGAAALGQVAAAYAAAGAIRAIPLAEGGIVNPTPGGTLARIGEGGRPEAVIPLDRAGGMGGVTIIQNIGGSVIAERQVKQLALAGMAQASRGY
jgi:hypothetical protein